MTVHVKTYKPKGDNADDVHEYVTAIAENSGVQGHEWLRAAEREENIWARLATNISRLVTFLSLL